MTHDVWQPLIWCKDAMPSVERLPALVRLRRDLRLAAQFSTYALNTCDLQALAEEICRVAAEGLGARFAKLLVYQPDERAFMLQAGVGWPDGIVGQARFDADVGTAAGCAWQSGQAIVCNNLVTDERFRVPDLLIEHGIVRSINVAVPSDGDEPFGVLEVESPEEGEFGAHDAHFLHVLAHSLAGAITRHARQDLHAAQLVECNALYATLLLEMQHRVRNDLQGISGSFADEARHSADPAQRESFVRVSRHVLALVALNNHLLGIPPDEDVDQLTMFPPARTIQASHSFSAFQSPHDTRFLDPARLPHNPERWRILARAWNENADWLSPGPERDIYLEIADGYAGLANLVDNVGSGSSVKAS